MSLGQTLLARPNKEGCILNIEGDVLREYGEYTFLAIKEGTGKITYTLGHSSVSLEVNVSSLESSKVSLYVPNGLQVDSNISATVTGGNGDAEIRVLQGVGYVSAAGTVLTGVGVGTATVVAAYGNTVSLPVEVSVSEASDTPSSVELELPRSTLYVGETFQMNAYTLPSASRFEIDYAAEGDSSLYAISGGYITGLKEGTIRVYAYSGDCLSSTQEVDIVLDEDPYEGISKSEFYASYVPACSSWDAKRRSEHGLLSGFDNSSQSRTPVYSSYRPMEGDRYILNSTSGFTSGQDGYKVYDAYGNYDFTVYEEGGYTSLIEIAAYLYAYGDVPANYIDIKRRSDDPTLFDEAYALWGSDLGTNNNYYSADTSSYPYEPHMPEATVDGGQVSYYEVDFYPNGYSNSRGTCRFVYSRYRNGSSISKPEDRYVFYTYNHYNDFEEFLNYSYGWGERFGNETAGNEADVYDPNNPPTSYPPVRRRAL